MKHLFSLFLFTMISCFAQKPVKDTIYGPVKTVYEKMIITDTASKDTDDIYYNDYGEFGFMGREITLRLKSMYWNETRFASYVNFYQEYDTLKRVTHETWYYKDGNIATDYELKYDNSNHLIEQREKDSEHNLEGIKIWTYDHKNRLISKISLHIDDYSGFKNEGFRYDDNDNLIEETHLTDDGKKSVLTHDYKNKKRISSYYYNDDLIQNQNRCSPMLRYVYKYDLNGNNIEIIDFFDYSSHQTQELSFSTLLKYDGRNNLTNSRTVGGMNFEREYSYNNSNQLILSIHKAQRQITERTEYFYENDHLSRLISYDNGKKYKVTFIYKFDQYNNWVEQEKIINGEIVIRRRRITYY